MKVKELKGKLDAVPDDYEVKQTDYTNILTIEVDDEEKIVRFLEDLPF